MTDLKFLLSRALERTWRLPHLISRLKHEIFAKIPLNLVNEPQYISYTFLVINSFIGPLPEESQIVKYY